MRGVLGSGAEIVEVRPLTASRWHANHVVNLALDYGPDAARRFLAAFIDRSGGAYTHDPYWDAVQLMDALAEDATPPPAAAFERLEAYLEDALD